MLAISFLCLGLVFFSFYIEFPLHRVIAEDETLINIT